MYTYNVKCLLLKFYLFFFESTCLWDILLGPVFQLALFCNFKIASGREEKAKIFGPKNSKINNLQLANKKKNNNKYITIFTLGPGVHFLLSIFC